MPSFKRTPRKMLKKNSRYSELGVQGRKTGVTIRVPIPRDADGLEDLDIFYANAVLESEEQSQEPGPAKEPSGLGSTDMDADSSIYGRILGNGTPRRKQSGKHTPSKGQQRRWLDLPTPGSFRRPLLSPLLRDKTPGRLGHPDDSDPADKHDMQFETLEDPFQASALDVLPLQNDDEEFAYTKVEASKPPAKKKTKTGRGFKAALRMSAALNSLRRSARSRVKPLDYWRNERKVFKIGLEAGTSVPILQEILRVPESAAEPGRRPRKVSRNGHAVIRSGGELVRTIEGQEDVEFENLENPDGIVLDPYTNEEVVRPLAMTLGMLKPQQVRNHSFKFQKVFSEEEYMSAGIMVLNKDGEKPNRSSGESSMVFLVLAGRVSIQVHRTSFLVPAGGMFRIPFGNQYHLKNAANRETKLFYFQVRHPGGLAEDPGEDDQSQENRENAASDP